MPAVVGGGHVAPGNGDRRGKSSGPLPKSINRAPGHPCQHAAARTGPVQILHDRGRRAAGNRSHEAEAQGQAPPLQVEREAVRRAPTSNPTPGGAASAATSTAPAARAARASKTAASPVIWRCTPARRQASARCPRTGAAVYTAHPAPVGGNGRRSGQSRGASDPSGPASSANAAALQQARSGRRPRRRDQGPRVTVCTMVGSPGVWLRRGDILGRNTCRDVRLFRSRRAGETGRK